MPQLTRKPFFQQPVKNKQEAYEKLVGNNTTLKTNKYKHSSTNFFIGRLEEDNGATVFSFAKKQQKTNLFFSINSLNITGWYKEWNIQKIMNLLNEASNSKFVTRKRNIIIDQSNVNYEVWNEIIFRIQTLWLPWCLHISKGWYWNARVTKVAFRNCTTFTSALKKLMEKRWYWTLKFGYANV